MISYKDVEHVGICINISTDLKVYIYVYVHIYLYKIYF